LSSSFHHVLPKHFDVLFELSLVRLLVKNREYVIIHSFGVSSESILAPLFGILYETVVAFLHAFRPVAVSSPPPLLDAATELPIALLIGSLS
jgi:hypothetical protein